jgi:transcriptional regulator with XRE-family HTH domain
MLCEFLKALPRELIHRRKLNGWTQKQLAEKLGLKEQQIQRYEKTCYQGVSLHRLAVIAATLEGVSKLAD